MTHKRDILRAAARSVALDALSLTQAALGARERALARPRVHFVYLHSVPPSELGQFRSMLQLLEKDHDFVPYSRAVQVAQSPTGPTRPALSFSFDDGFASNTLAAAELEKFGASACFFVPTGFIGCQTVAEARQFFRTDSDAVEPAMSWQDLETLVDRGHEVGNHTSSHRVLASLSPDELVTEIGGSRERLQQRLGQGDHFAWPRGRFTHFSAAAARCVFDTGHLSCASAERGAHAVSEGNSGALCIRREHVMTSWPLRHSLYFMAKSAKRPGLGSWPEGWLV